MGGDVNNELGGNGNNVEWGRGLSHIIPASTRRYQLAIPTESLRAARRGDCREGCPGEEEARGKVAQGTARNAQGVGRMLWNSGSLLPNNTVLQWRTVLFGRRTTTSSVPIFLVPVPAFTT